jgi:hypothetical protein
MAIDPTPPDFLRAARRAVLEGLSREALRWIGEGLVPVGTPTPYAQLVDTGGAPHVTKYLEFLRQTFRVSSYGRDKAEVQALADAIRGVLEGQVLAFADGRQVESIQWDGTGGREDLPGTGPGGRNVWRQDDRYWADLIEE